MEPKRACLRNKDDVEAGKISYYEWSEEKERQALEILAEDVETIPDKMYKKYDSDANKFWDKFYKNNQTNFYKDRHYLTKEFTELTLEAFTDRVEGKEKVETYMKAYSPLKERFDTLSAELKSVRDKLREAQEMEKKEKGRRIQEQRKNRKKSNEKTSKEPEESKEETEELSSKSAEIEQSVKLQEELTQGLRGVKEEIYTLTNSTFDEEAYMTLMEIGCGVGNAFFPLLMENPLLKVCATDFSKRAVYMASKHEDFREDRVCLDVNDIATQDIPEKFTRPNFALLLFVLSAISPEKHESSLKKIYDQLKPGGVLFFRDYGRYDLAQLNFAKRKKNKLKDNFYVRYDGTRTFYFEKDEAEALLKDIGFEIYDSENHLREIKNRKLDLTMNRVWIQIKARKPLSETVTTSTEPQDSDAKE